MKSLSFWLLRVIVAGLVLVTGRPAEADRGTFANKRAIMDGDIEGWTQPVEIDRRLQRIKAAGFNVYMPAVWYGRGTTWPSKYAPWDFALQLPIKRNFDPLKYAIEKAHTMGLEVHPWFTVTLRWKSDFYPELGLPGVSEGPHAAFNIHNADFRLLITSLIAEVVTNYDVDGINLDYVRAMGVCRTSSCDRDYFLKYNRDLGRDSLIFKIAPMSVPTLVAFQEEGVSKLVTTISSAIRREKPGLLISVDVHPELIGQARYVDQGQNSIDWVNTGIVDVLLRMDYQPTLGTNSIESVRRQLKVPDAMTQLISNMSHGADMPANQKHVARSGKWLTDTISMIQSRWPGTGVAVYFYKYLTDEQIEALQKDSSGSGARVGGSLR